MTLIRVLKNNRALRREAYATLYTLVPHDANNDDRKTVTLLLVGSWLSLTAAIMLGVAVPTEGYGLLSVIVWTRFGKIQEQEAQRLAGLVAPPTGPAGPHTPDDPANARDGQTDADD